MLVYKDIKSEISILWNDWWSLFVSWVRVIHLNPFNFIMCPFILYVFLGNTYSEQDLILSPCLYNIINGLSFSDRHWPFLSTFSVVSPNWIFLPNPNLYVSTSLVALFRWYIYIGGSVFRVHFTISGSENSDKIIQPRFR